MGTTGSPYRLDGLGNTIQYYLYMLNYEAMDDGMACMMDDYPAESGTSEPMLIGGPTGELRLRLQIGGVHQGLPLRHGGPTHLLARNWGRARDS